jgi:ribose transport system ATP-binding protein
VAGQVAREPARLALRGVSKRYGATRALDGVSLEATGGEVHAVLGENGAGKSTLMKILAGAVRPDAGTIELDGRPFAPSSPAAAREAGVAMVHQEPMLCAHLSVAENVMLGAEPEAFGLVRKRELVARARAALIEVTGEPTVDLDLPAGRLPVGQRQLVSMARALAQGAARVLILDEPTASLGSADRGRLFAAVERLRADGRIVLYISHFLEEVQRVAQRFTVVRDGRSVATGSLEGSRLEDLVEAIIGRKLEQLFHKSTREPGEVALSLEGLAGAGDLPRDCSLQLRRGEILGIAGLVGAGRTELLRAIFGLDPVRRGTITVGAWSGAASMRERLDQGVGLLSEDRKGESLAQTMTIADNVTLSRLDGLGPAGLVLPGRQRAVAERWTTELAVRCNDVGQPVGELSGGNQQKVALARLLHHDVDVLLLDEPTRGIDVGSRAEIYRLIDALAAKGKAVLMVSSSFPELLGTCDRVAVMHRGRLGEARPAADLDEHGLVLAATGAAR